MLPEADLLSHLMCSPPVFIGDGGAAWDDDSAWDGSGAVEADGTAGSCIVCCATASRATRAVASKAPMELDLDMTASSSRGLLAGGNVADPVWVPAHAAL